MFVPAVRLPPEMTHLAWKYSVVSNVIAKLLTPRFCVELFRIPDLNEVPSVLGVDDLYKSMVTVTPAGMATVDEKTPSKTITF